MASRKNRIRGSRDNAGHGQDADGKAREQSDPAGAAAGPASRALLEVRDLRIHFPTADGVVKAVDGVSFRLEKGRTLGIVGESGSGKSVTSLGIMGLHERTNAKIEGHIWLDGEDLVTASPTRIRELRGSKKAARDHAIEMLNRVGIPQAATRVDDYPH